MRNFMLLSLSATMACSNQVSTDEGYVDDRPDFVEEDAAEDENSSGKPNQSEDQDEDDSEDSSSDETEPEDLDADGDGFTATDGDCNDMDDTVFPGAMEICDGRDNDCDGEVDGAVAEDAKPWYFDGDGDGAGAGSPRWACEALSDEWVASADDCDDMDASIHPLADEICDGRDNDCDDLSDEGDAAPRTWYQDEDLDGYGLTDTDVIACEAPSEAYVELDGDCNDADGEIHPGAEERCSTVDRDCDGDVGSGLATWYGTDEVVMDLTEDMRSADATVELSRDGILRLCEGEWATRIIVDANDVTIKGVGEAESIILDGGSAGSTIVAKERSDYLTVRNLVVTGGDADQGGGIRATTADVVVEDAFIRDNEASSAGAGIYVGTGSLILHATEVSGNMLSSTTTAFGAGIRMERGDVEIYDSSIFANGGIGQIYGGGISVAEGDLILEQSSVDENEATMSGGGVVLGDGRVSMIDSRIRNNEAGEYGGGLKISGSLYMDNSVVRDNTAQINGGGAYVAVRSDGTAPSVMCTAEAAISSGFRGNLTVEGLGGGVYSAASHFEIESDTCDWGAGESNNTPHDVRMRDWIGGASADASFECNNRHGCGDDDDMWTREP